MGQILPETHDKHGKRRYEERQGRVKRQVLQKQRNRNSCGEAYGHPHSAEALRTTDVNVLGAGKGLLSAPRPDHGDDKACGNS